MHDKTQCPDADACSPGSRVRAQGGSDTSRYGREVGRQLNAFTYRNGRLHVEDVDLATIAREIGTPFYCYSATALRRRFLHLRDVLAGTGTSILYAVKANSNLAVIHLLGGLGAGADVVSAGEIHRCLAAGLDASTIVFSGVGKSREEIVFALESGVRQINVESEGEFDRIGETCDDLNREAPVAFRFNPDVDAGGHEKISTGRQTDKFGLPAAVIRHLWSRARAHPLIRPVGLAVHIGSQIHEVELYRTAFDRLLDLAGTLDGVATLDLGGGLGIAYHEEEEAIDLGGYASLLADVRRRTDAELAIEPGRWLVASAGALVTGVNTVKQAGSKRVVIVDAAMNDLVRPTLYGARHPVWPHREATPPRFASLVAGPVCESGDVLAHDAPLPALEDGDLLAIGHAGAYGAVMASGYNGRLLVPEVMVEQDRLSVVRRRPGHDEMMALETVPGLQRDDAVR